MKENRKPLTILILVVLAIQAVCGWMIFLSFGNWSDRGTFGDMFGAVNTLFSGLAFAGVIYAIILQKKELALQRQELEETRKELARSASAQEKSERALADQVKVAAVAARLQSANEIIKHIERRREKLLAVSNAIRDPERIKENQKQINLLNERQSDINDEVFELYNILQKTQVKGKVDE